MEIQGIDFPEIPDIKKIMVKNRHSSEIFPLAGNSTGCIIIQHTEGSVWIGSEKGHYFPLTIEEPGFISGKNCENFNIRVNSIADNNIGEISFTLVFIKVF